MRNHIDVLEILLLAFILSGCAVNDGSSVQSEQVMSHSKQFQEDNNYDDLRWLADNYLHKGMKRGNVLAVLGNNLYRWHTDKDLPGGVLLMDSDGPDPESSIWIYTGDREELNGNYLYINFTGPENNATVVSWEWASE